MIKSKIVYILVITLLSLNTFSQSRKAKRADMHFESKEYFLALDLYKEAYKDSKDKPEKAYLTFRLAECYRFINNTKKAEIKYKSCIKKQYSNPIAVLYFADMLKKNEKYTEAVEQYAAYVKLIPDDIRGTMGLESCELAEKWRATPTRYMIANIKEFNTKEMEFTPAYVSDDYKELYFTSTRKKDNFTKFNNVSGQNFTDIFSSKLDRKGEWSEPEPVVDTINSPYDEGSPSMSSDYRSMYFTRCRVKRGELLGCQIFKGVRSAGEDWSSTEMMQIVDDSINVGHPAISKDELTMYFVATMARGYGQTDIYKVVRKTKGGRWGSPINLGPDINTIGNEVYPFIREDGTLFFSSDYHLGMGGLDIFKATKNGKKSWKIENVKYPINSYSDDFAIIFKGNEEEGFFTSTRKITELPTDPPTIIRGKGGDDIYSFILPPINFVLEGTIKDESTDEPIDGATIKFYGSDGTDITLTTDSLGEYKYRLSSETDYVFKVSKKGYLNGKGKETTETQIYSKTFENNIYLSQIDKPVEIQNILYDFGKWELREESKPALEKLVDVLKNNPNITIELGSHTDKVGEAKANIILSQKRAQAVIDYLIEYGINKDRLTAKGYGESVPKILNLRIAKESRFEYGDTMNLEFVNTLEVNLKNYIATTEDLEEKKVKKMAVLQARIDEANQINRRTEFKVISTKYISEIDW